MEATYQMGLMDALGDYGSWTADTTYADGLVALTVANLAVRSDYWTAFAMIAEPGADGHWKVTSPSGRGAYDPAKVFKAIRRELEVYGVTPRSPRGLHIRPEE